MMGENRLKDFFHLGGTMKEGAPSYIERPADQELWGCLERREYCSINAPRQTGKSSLMTHAAAALKRRARERGTDDRSVLIDLQGRGTERDPERWFVPIVEKLGSSLKLETVPLSWWKSPDRSCLGPVDRFATFLRDVVLDEITGEVVVFVDEIDNVFGLPFSDDFFLTIRSLYNERATGPGSLERLTFVLAGLVPPSKFIQNRWRSPFNVGTVIELGDIDRERAVKFDNVLGSKSREAVDRIFHWTGGQPYLLQRLTCAASLWDERERVPVRIDREVSESLLNCDIDSISHFTCVRNLLTGSSQTRKALQLYVKILRTGLDGPPILGARRPHEIAYRKNSRIHEQLREAGVVRAVGGFLKPRNRIYATVFNEKWARSEMPFDSTKIVGSLSVVAIFIVSMFLMLNWYTRTREERARNAALELGGIFERKDGENKLIFRQCKRFGPNVELFTYLSDVNTLDFEDSRLNDDDLARLGHLDALQSFNVRFLKPIGLGLPGLGGLTDLEKLNLSKTSITDEGVTSLRRLTGLKSLQLGHLELTDQGLAAVGSLTSLKTLDLNDTKITAAGLNGIASLKALESLGLGNTKITGEGLKSLAKLTALEQLFLTGTPLVDADLRLLEHKSGLLYGLRLLDLGGTKATGDGLAALEGVNRLRTLGLDARQLDEAGLGHLKKIQGLTRLIVAGLGFPERVAPRVSDYPTTLGLIVLSGDRSLEFSNGSSFLAGPDGLLSLDVMWERTNPLTIVVDGSALNAVLRRWLRGLKDDKTDHFVVVAWKNPDGTPAFDQPKNVSYAHFLELIEKGQLENLPKFTAVRLLKTDSDPSFTTVAGGRLSMIAPELTFEVPAPPGSDRGGLLGRPTKVLRFLIPLTKFVFSWEVEPASTTSALRFRSRIESIDFGPSSKVQTVNDREDEAITLGPFQSNLALQGFRNIIEQYSIEIPITKLQETISGYKIIQLESLGHSGFLRLALDRNKVPTDSPKDPASVEVKRWD